MDMSDTISQVLAAYATSVPDELDADTAHETKRRLIDTLAVALGAHQQPAPRAARRYAYAFEVADGCRIWGTPFASTPEVATLANGVAVRYFDYNDTYLSLEPLHPSDTIAGLISAAEWIGASGRQLLTAVAVAYEVGMTLCDALSVRRHGWDHVNVTSIAACCGLGRLLDLDQRTLEQALAITVVPHAAMRQTRAGELSMWKGFAAADAVRQAVYACALAASGVTGPYRPFEGEMGFVQQLLGGRVPNRQAIDRLAAARAPTRIAESYLKAWPVEYHAQSAVQAALSLHHEVKEAGAIEEVTIETFKAAYEIIAKDPEKWRPQTRETADHSLPYIVSVALLDGQVDQTSFSSKRIRDETLQAFLKDKVTLLQADDLSAGYPDGIPSRITVKSEGGSKLVREVTYPIGHARNRMTDERLEEKYRELTEPLLGEAHAGELLNRLRALEAIGDVSDLTAQLVV